MDRRTDGRTNGRWTEPYSNTSVDQKITAQLKIISFAIYLIPTDEDSSNISGMSRNVCAYSSKPGSCVSCDV